MNNTTIISSIALEEQRLYSGVGSLTVSEQSGIDHERQIRCEASQDDLDLTLEEVQRWCDAVGCSVLDVIFRRDIDMVRMARADLLAIGESGEVSYLHDTPTNRDAARVYLDKFCGGGVLVSTTSPKRPEGWGDGSLEHWDGMLTPETLVEKDRWIVERPAVIE